VRGVSQLDRRRYADAYATLTGAAAINDPSAVNVVQVILNGARRPTLGSTVIMPAFGEAYSDTEIAAVANYVTARFGPRRHR